MLREFQDEINKLKAMLGDGADGGVVGDGGGTERVVTKSKKMDPAELEKMRAEMEAQMREEMSAKMAAQLEKMRAEMEAQMREEMSAKMAAQAQLEELKANASAKAKEEAAKVEDERARLAEKQDRLKDENAKGEARGGLEAVTKKKEAELQRKAEELVKRRIKDEEEGEARGGLEAVTKKKEAELQRKAEELVKRRIKDEEEAKRVAEMEESQLAQEDKFGSKAEEAEQKTKKLKKLWKKFQEAEEAEQKTKKLKKLWKKFQEVNAEVEDMYAEFQREKEDLIESIRMLQDQMQLKDMVIEAFIPTEEVQKVMRRAHWDDEREVWVLERLSDIMSKRDPATSTMRRPVSASGTRRPTSDFAKLASAMGDMNPRFKSENILNLERTTYDYEGPGVDPRVQAAINAAFADDGELLFVGSAEAKSGGFMDGGAAQPAGDDGGRPGSARARPSSARRQSKAGR
eukprot:gene12352-15530_t